MDAASYLNANRGLEIRQDADLLDTDYGRFSGQSWDELDQRDRAWDRFTTDPLHAPKGVERFADVQRRAVRAAERWRQATDVGEWVALVTHADLVKLIVAHYVGVPRLCAADQSGQRLGNAVAFHPSQERRPSILSSIGQRPRSNGGSQGLICAQE